MNHTVNVYNSEGKQGEALVLSLADAVALPLSAKNFAVNVRVLFQNWRQGTLGSKGRADLAFSNKKPWKQKGTGRARAGTIRSPLWRKGGAIFGPQARVRQLSVNVKQKRYAMNNVLHSVLGRDALYCLDFVAASSDKPSTKLAFNSLKNLGLAEQKVNLFLSFGDEVAFSSFINLPNVRIIFYDQPNVYDLATSDCWVFLKKDFDFFKEMILQWN